MNTKNRGNVEKNYLEEKRAFQEERLRPVEKKHKRKISEITTITLRKLKNDIKIKICKDKEGNSIGDQNKTLKR